MALWRVCAGLCHQSAGLAPTHLAARRPRRGADGRQRGAGGGPAENGHVWLFALLTPPVPAGCAPVRAAPLCTGYCRDPLRRHPLVGPAPTVTAWRHVALEPMPVTAPLHDWPRP